MKESLEDLGPVVQSTVSLMTSFRHQFVEYMPTTKTNSNFSLEKCENLLQHCKRFSHFSNKNNSVFDYL